MGLIQNKVTVSQPNSHVVVKNAGGLRGLTGETGPQGPQGVPGEAATVTAGTTTTLPAGSDATVENVGSTSAAIFNFGIPKGDKGDTGADGFSPTATVTKTGDTATITITDKDGTTTASISDGVTPTVNDGTLTIQKNGTTVQTFSADQASNVTANITVPTQFSELSGTVSSSQIEDEAITTGSVSGTGTNITLAGTMEGGAIDSVEMNGDTQQTTYSGKNLLKLRETSGTANGVTYTPNNDGTFNLSGTATAATEFSAVVPIAQSGIVGGQQYIVNTNIDNIGIGKIAYYVHSCDSAGVWKKTLMAFNEGNNQVRTCVVPTSDGYVKFVVRVENGFNATASNIQTQIVKGTTAGTWEPYVGGTASPNPDYPQEVQTVTGEQTITISDGNGQSQSYTVDLGDIELCKIGTYQDKIYKSGEDWYVHKETTSFILDGTKGGFYSSWYYVSFSALDITNVGGNNLNAFSSNFTAYNYSTFTDNTTLNGMAQSGSNFIIRNINYSDTAGYQTWLASTLPKVYYPLATPTDTKITNATLISELDSLLSATTYDNNTYITVSGDLASPLEVVAEADSKLAPDSVYGAAIKDGAVSTDKIEDGAVTPDKISTSTYQSGETAVGTWIDGKTIYRQVLTGTVQITANTVATVTTTIAAKSIVSTSGWYQSWKQNDTTSNKVAFGHIMGDKVYSYALIRSGNYIELGFISTVNVNSQYEVVVEYTKKD